MLKILLPVENVAFEGAVFYQFKTNEYWVYMSPGEKALTVKIPNCAPYTVHLDKYLHDGVESKRIYELLLSGYPPEEAMQYQENLWEEEMRYPRRMETLKSKI